MATGTPVIAYGKWGALETIKDGVSGVFFHEQTIESLNNAIKEFEWMKFDPKKIRKHSLKWDRKSFQEKIRSYISNNIK